MIADDLFLVLKNFQGVREKQGENEKLTNLANQFMNVAENKLLGACFEINGVWRIYPLERICVKPRIHAANMKRI